MSMKEMNILNNWTRVTNIPVERPASECSHSHIKKL